MISPGTPRIRSPGLPHRIGSPNRRGECPPRIGGANDPPGLSLRICGVCYRGGDTPRDVPHRIGGANVLLPSDYFHVITSTNRIHGTGSPDYGANGLPGGLGVYRLPGAISTNDRGVYTGRVEYPRGNPRMRRVSALRIGDMYSLPEWTARAVVAGIPPE